jgi:REP element-mobilizing transposase RayT
VKPAIPRRQAFRLQNYAYASEGLYFVTICTFSRSSIFGPVVDGKMNLNEMGKMADEVWSSMFRFLEDVDTWIVMPNHLHGIVAIDGDHARSPENRSSTW